MLRVESLDAGYETLPVVQSMTLEVRPGEVVALVGHNGSGKTTALWGVAGLTWARAARLDFEDISMLAMPPWARARMGIAIALQNGGIFHHLSVEDNLSVAGVSRSDRPLREAGLALTAILDRLLHRPRLLAGSLSGGEQRALTLAMASARHPRLLLADEPSLGLAEGPAKAALDYLAHLAAEERTAVLLVTHDRDAVLRHATRLYVLTQGRISCVLAGEDARQRPELLDKAYAGTLS